MGIVIDDRLSWKPHIRHTQSKVSKCISIISRAKYLLEYNALYVLYCSLILPYLTYGVEIWGNNYKSLLYPLCILQKRVIRIINKVAYLEHTNRLFLQCKILKLMDLVKLKTAMFLFKASKNNLPNNIQQLFTVNDSGYYLRGYSNFQLPAVRTTRRTWCVSVCGVKLWNSLDTNLKRCSTVKKFKYQYKQSVWSQYLTEECQQ